MLEEGRSGNIDGPLIHDSHRHLLHLRFALHAVEGFQMKSIDPLNAWSTFFNACQVVEAYYINLVDLILENTH
jgi:hypothetical protein